MAVRKTAKGAALKRWFKEDWRTPKGNKDYSKEKTLLGLLKKYLKTHLKLGANSVLLIKLKLKKKRILKVELVNMDMVVAIEVKWLTKICVVVEQECHD